MLNFHWFFGYFFGFCKTARIGAGKDRKKPILKTSTQQQPGAEMEPNMMLATIVGARGLYMKNKSSLEAFVTVTLQGKGSLRSRCATEAVHTEGDCRWDEVCEFKLSEKFTTVSVAVHSKAKLGSGELIGKCELELENAKALNGQTNWLRLKKKNSDEKYRGEVQLKMDFSYEKPNMSVSSLSINQLGMEQKEGGSGGGGGLMSKMKRKITQAKNGHKKAEDTMSMASAWSATSKTSTKSGKFFGKLGSKLGLKSGDKNSATLPVGTFLTPMDNHLDGGAGGGLYENGGSKAPSRNSSFNVYDTSHNTNNTSSRPPSSFANNTSNALNPFADSMSPQPPQPAQRTSTPTGRFITNGSATLPHAMTSPVMAAQDVFRRSGSIRSVASSGFGGSTKNQQKIIDPSNSEDLLAVIDSLKLELQVKDSRMKDMQGYMDLLISRVMERNPELLAAPAKEKPSRMRFF